MKYRLSHRGHEVVRRDALIKAKLISPQGASGGSITGKHAIRFPAIGGLPEIEHVD